MKLFEDLRKKLGHYFEKGETRELRKFVDPILSRSKEFDELSSQDFKNKTAELKERLNEGATIDDILIDAFALACAAIHQVLSYKPFSVQIMGGVALHRGRITEMKAGEGKTVTAVMPVYLNAISGQGVHIITTNDYLAKRDSQWMGPVYELLGLSVGAIFQEMEGGERKKNYERDITYVTNQEVGFDYLKDNLVFNDDERILRDLNFAIVDEVDSILIDEVRTPLIISRETHQSGTSFRQFVDLVNKLEENKDYEVDKRLRLATLTESGLAKVDALLGKNIFTQEYIESVLYLYQALQSKAIFKRDHDYIVFNEKVTLVNEFTGRPMPDQRFMEGLHEAIEAKEMVPIRKKDRILASITFQNFFKLYKKLSGMTGTIGQSKKEFLSIYHIDSVIIPTNKPTKRVDAPDRYFDTEEIKFESLIRDVVFYRDRGQPVLVGTRSVEKSTILSRLLEKINIPHKVLNAKYHELEAENIQSAGAKFSVTVATNMAGRGTDIIISDDVRQSGGLIVLGSERNLAGRIDDQLRGRAGRQGDLGFSQFYVSLEDDLVQNYTDDDFWDYLEKSNSQKRFPPYDFLASNINYAQELAETLAFDSRFYLAQFDELINKQRMFIYAQRNRIIGDNDLLPELKVLIYQVIGDLIEISYEHFVSAKEQSEYLLGLIRKLFYFDPKNILHHSLSDEVINYLGNLISEAIPERNQMIIKKAFLKVIDPSWSNYLENIAGLEQAVSLFSIGQRDPMVGFVEEADQMFKKLLRSMRIEIIKIIFATFYKISQKKYYLE